MLDPSQTGGNIAATLSLQQHNETATQGKMGAGGFLGDVDQANMGQKISDGVFNSNLFGEGLIDSISIPQGVFNEDIGKTIGDLSKRATSPVFIGAEEAALKGATTTAISTAAPALGSSLVSGKFDISSAKQKGGMSVNYQ
ncbi:MAG: hypothetical protein ISP24_00905 [Rickettsiales bacterium]|nr:hypothetical protein [Rickettsiales bacterium]